VAQAGGLALGRQFLPPALKKKLGKAFRFAPAVTSFAEQCGDLAEADIPEPVGLASQKGRLDHAYQTIQFVRGHLANADGYTAETRFYAGRVSRCKHIPEKQFFVSLNRSALWPATFGPTISG
jgi:hypothetical protein